MDLATIREGLRDAGLPSEIVDETLGAYAEAKRRYHLDDHRPNAVEGGRFSEAVFRLLQHRTTGEHTPLGRPLPKVDNLLEKLSNISADMPSEEESDPIRLHIPRTLRLIYDLRNKRNAAHLARDIDPNLQDATLVISNMDWVMAELVRLYHDISADEAQTIIDDLVTKEVPTVQEIAGQPVILKDLQPQDQALLMLYRAGTDAGASVDEVASWLRVDRKDHLRTRLRRLDDKALALEHPETGRFHITHKGIREVDDRDLAKPA